MDFFTFNSLSSKFIFFAGSMSIVIAIAELFVLKRRFENYIWAVLLSVFGLFMFQAGFMINGMIFVYSVLLMFYSQLIFLVGLFGSSGYAIILAIKFSSPVVSSC